MNKMHWIGWAAALSVASAPMTAFAFCFQDKQLVNGSSGTFRCSSGSDAGEGHLALNPSTYVGAGSVFLRTGTISASMQGIDQFGGARCVITDPAPANAFAVTRNVTCTNAVLARLMVD